VDELTGRVAVVTGAASGIGLALCEAFAAEGMHVVMADVEPERLRTEATQLRSKVATEVLDVVADVARWDDVQALESRTVERFGAVHVLCNNAGVQCTGTAWELSLAEWEWLLGVNLWGVIHGVRAFVPGMVRRGVPAHVVNTASIGGLLAFPGMAMYTAAKFAVVGLSETLSHDLRDSGAPVGVSVLCPGPTVSHLRENSRELRPDGPDGRALRLVTDVDRIPAAEVASQVVDAIGRDRFWVLTHPAYHETIEHRYRGIVETDELVVPPLL